MELSELDNEAARQWDSVIENYESKRPFHNLAWLEYLKQTQGGKKRLFELRQDAQVLGYFCGLEIKKGPFKIFGSPLQGWNTPEMGPLIDEDIDQAAVIKAIYDYFRKNDFSVLEFSNVSLDNKTMRAQGFGFYRRYTSILYLSSKSENELWSSLSSNCRTRIRKARKNNLTVEIVDDNTQAFIDEYYIQLKEVFRRRSSAVPYKKERVDRLFNFLKEKDMLLALRVKNSKDEPLACGIFICDKKYMFLFGMASKTKYLNLSPNELLVWESIRIAKERGISVYDLGGLGTGGLGRFKNKFKGANKEIIHWRRFFSLQARFAYFIYKVFLLTKLHLLKWSL